MKTFAEAHFLNDFELEYDHRNSARRTSALKVPEFPDFETLWHQRWTRFERSQNKVIAYRQQRSILAPSPKP